MENKEINFELLQKVVNQIAKYPNDFTAEILYDSEENTETEYEPRTFFQKITDFFNITSPKITKEVTITEESGNVAYWVVKLSNSNPKEINILWEAQKLLNITDEQARSLFYPHWYPYLFRCRYAACKKDTEWSEWVVIQRLQYFIDHKGDESGLVEKKEESTE